MVQVTRNNEWQAIATSFREMTKEDTLYISWILRICFDLSSVKIHLVTLLERIVILSLCPINPVGEKHRTKAAANH